MTMLRAQTDSPQAGSSTLPSRSPALPVKVRRRNYVEVFVAHFLAIAEASTTPERDAARMVAFKLLAALVEHVKVDEETENKILV